MRTVHDFHIEYASGGIREYRLIHNAKDKTLHVFKRTFGIIHSIRSPLAWRRSYQRENVGIRKLNHERALFIAANYSRGLSAHSRILETRLNSYTY